MSTVGVNPPKTPVTEGSSDKSPATLPNVCKMPGPPAPFVPTPLPNIGQSSDGLVDGTTTVKFEGKKVAIKGSSYTSKLSPDMASKGTGGGLISSTTEGKTKFVAPGSMNVKADGKNIQLLGDAMSNNGSNPDNSATVPGNLQAASTPAAIRDALSEIAKHCNDTVNATYKTPPKGKTCTKAGTQKHKCCDDAIKKANNPSVKSEVAYDKAGKSIGKKAVDKAKKAANKAYKAAKDKARRQKKSMKKATKGVWAKAFFGQKAVYLIADAVVTKPDGTKAPFDFKFNCSGKGKMSAKQKKKYNNVFDKAVEIIGPPKF